MISLEFTYDNCVYNALARIKKNQGLEEYAITIMNGELEARLYGEHIFKLRDGIIVAMDGNDDLHDLKSSICNALNKNLGKLAEAEYEYWSP